MKRLLLLLALMGMVAVSCSKEQPNENEGGNQGDIPENIFFALDKESITISPDGGSVDVVVYSNYKWEISGTSDWCTPSITNGEANEDGQKVTFSADMTYDDREATFWFRCADEKTKLVVSQKLKAVIIPDENNSFNIPAEGGIAVISYQTSVDCEIIIPQEAQDWITIVPATRGLVSESVTLNIAENTTYDPRTAVIKVVAKDNAELVVEYTINQEQNNALLVDENNTFTVPSTGGEVVINYQTNVDCDVIIPEEAQNWITIVPATRGLVSESISLDIAENTTYDPRTAVIKVVAKDNAELVIEYTIHQEQNDAILADENNTFTVPSTGGEVVINYQTNVDCEVIIPQEAQDWITIAPATRGLVSEGVTLNIAENTTYDPRTAVIKVVAKDNAELVVEYTINQEQNNALLVDENNTFTVPSTGGEVVINYQTNVDCEVIIPEEAQDWITIAPATRGLVTYNTTLNITANDSGKQRSCVVKVISQDHNELFAEYTITQYMRCILYYTSNDGKIVKPNNSSSFDAGILSNTYNDGVGVIEFNAPITTIGDRAFEDCISLTSVTIPDSVTEIGSYAFMDCTTLTSVTIPNSVTKIGSYAFYNCSSLTSVTIPDSVTEIGEYAFAYCGSLTSVTIPNSVTKIGSYAFYNCISLTSVTIPDSVTEIGDGAFMYCTTLTSVTIPNSVTKIGSDAFYNCISLTSVTIPDSVTEIGDGVFKGCSSLTSVTIPDSVTEIGSDAFRYCSSLTSVTIPNSVTEISSWAFSGCISLTSVTIPDSVTEIGSYAFYNCRSLEKFNGKFASEDGRCLIIEGVLNSFAPAGMTKYTIPDSVTTIGDNAFMGCMSLTSVTIPDSVTEIGDYAFYGCISLTSVYCKAATPPMGGSDMFDNTASGCKIYVPTASVSAYKNASGWDTYASDIVGYNF